MAKPGPKPQWTSRMWFCTSEEVRAAMTELAALSGRTYSAEVRIAVNNHLKAAGIDLPEDDTPQLELVDAQPDGGASADLQTEPDAVREPEPGADDSPTASGEAGPDHHRDEAAGELIAS